MKKNFLPFIAWLVLLFLDKPVATAQVPDWKWAQGESKNGGSFAEAIAKDRAGNIYATGSVHIGSIAFGAAVTPAIMDTARGIYFGTYLAKFTPSGKVIWLKVYEGAEPRDMAVDKAGNIYLTGSFSEEAVFGTDTLQVPNGTATFLAKIDSAGSAVWARQAAPYVAPPGTPGGAIDPTTGVSIAVNNRGEVFMIGKGFGMIDTILHSSGSSGSDFYLSKWNSSGRVEWVEKKLASPVAIAADTLGNCYITGNGITILKVDGSGRTVWTYRPSGSTDSGLGLILDNSGGILVTGGISSETIFGADTLRPVDKADMFLLKLDTVGTVLWAVNDGGSEDASGSALATGANGDIYVAGTFTGSTFFGQNIVYTNPFHPDVFVAKYSSNGQAVWGRQAGGAYSDYVSGIAVQPSGECYVTGSSGISTNITFGSLSLPGNSAWVAKLASTPLASSEETDLPELLLYPNPATATALLQAEVLAQKGAVVNVFNLQGKLVHQVIAEGNRTVELPVQGWPKGLYLVQVQTVFGILNKKLVVE